MKFKPGGYTNVNNDLFLVKILNIYDLESQIWTFCKER
jgi:hypothetical protein